MGQFEGPMNDTGFERDHKKCNWLSRVFKTQDKKKETPNVAEQHIDTNFV